MTEEYFINPSIAQAIIARAKEIHHEKTPPRDSDTAYKQASRSQGRIANAIHHAMFGGEDPQPIIDHIINTAAIAFFWRQYNHAPNDKSTSPTQTVLEDVRQERVRTIEKWGRWKSMPPQDWLMVLVEEVGEFGDALEADPPDPQHTTAEADQIIAVCISWREQQEHDNDPMSGWTAENLYIA